MKTFLKLSVFFAVVIVSITAHRTGIFTEILLQFRRLGPYQPVAFILTYALTCIFFIPSLIFAFAGGILFGLPLGILYGAFGNALGSTVALLIGRYFFHGLAEQWALRHQKFQALTLAVAQKGWKIVTLARLTPVFPFLFANYLFGLTKITVLSYFSASFLGSIPSTSVYAYTGMLAGDFQSAGSGLRERTPLEWALLAVGLLATVILTYYLRKIAQSALNRTVPDFRQSN